MSSVPAPTPIDSLIMRFSDLVTSFETAPTLEKLRELERLAMQLMDRLRSLGAAALALLQGLLARVIAVVLSPTAAVWGGAVAGAAILWWGYYILVAGHITVQVPDPDATARDIAGLVFLQLQMWGMWHVENLRERCWDEFIEALIEAARAAQQNEGTVHTPDFHRQLLDLIAKLLECLFGDQGLGLSPAGRAKIIDLIKDMLRQSPLWSALGLTGLSFPEDRRAPRDRAPSGDGLEQEIADLVKRLGLKGIPRGDGFGYCESLAEAADAPSESEKPKGPCDIMMEDVELKVDIPFDGFPDADLEKRREILECWKKYLNEMIEEDRKLLGSAPFENDTSLRDLLLSRIENHSREANRVCAALQNIKREQQIREARRRPVVPPGLESRLRLKYPPFLAPGFIGSYR